MCDGIHAHTVHVARAHNSHEWVMHIADAKRASATAEAVTLHAAGLPSVGTMLNRSGTVREGRPIRGRGHEAGSGSGGEAEDIVRELRRKTKDKSGGHRQS